MDSLGVQNARLDFSPAAHGPLAMNLQDLEAADDVEAEVPSDRRAGKRTAVKLVKVKPEIPEE